jgi:hypothetical protein
MHCNPHHRVVSVILAAGTVCLWGCRASVPKEQAAVLGERASLPEVAGASAGAPVPGFPLGVDDPRRIARPAVVRSGPIPQLPADGPAVWGTAAAERIDSRRLNNGVGFGPGVGLVPGVAGPVKEVLPPHRRPVLYTPQEPNALTAGAVRAGERAEVQSQFSGLDRTGWVPPDPTLAVGPNHVVETVNQSIAWYTKAGVRQFSNALNNAGSPGFFETVGARGFAFDPKCFYDHIAQRFVVLALEVYNDDESYITFAVSDDSDPNGVWYKYRTDAVIADGATTYWWDYPGFGYDQQAYYVTGNLFGLNQSAFGGAGFRVINKQSVLNGGTASFATLRSGDSASVQVCQHFGNNPAAYFVSLGNGSRTRLHAITDPLTNPTLFRRSILVPNYGGTSDAPVVGGGALSVVDPRIMNAQWRDGRVWAAHHVGVDGVNTVRWYEFNTQDWPFSGDYTLVQSGNVSLGAGVHTFFPAIYTNAQGSAGLIFGASSASRPVELYVTGRRASDAPGTMGTPALVRSSTIAGTSGRWGDYFDLALDPADNATFWAIGQTDEAGIGWDTRIVSFRVDADCLADVTGDGVVDSGDLAQFISVFIAAGPAADVTGDGTVDSGDLAAFIAAFLAGC